MTAKNAAEIHPPDPPAGAQALQWGMNIARKFIWKYMQPGSRARYLLRKTLASAAAAATKVKP